MLESKFNDVFRPQRGRIIRWTEDRLPSSNLPSPEKRRWLVWVLGPDTRF